CVFSFAVFGFSTPLVRRTSAWRRLSSMLWIPPTPLTESDIAGAIDNTRLCFLRRGYATVRFTVAGNHPPPEPQPRGLLRLPKLPELARQHPRSRRSFSRGLSRRAPRRVAADGPTRPASR